jgi:hypothetical protein
MTTYKLTENNKSESVLPISRIKNRYFFRDGDADCYALQSHVEHMKENHITEMTLWLAEKETDAPYFFCKHFLEIGEKSEGGCGNLCTEYKPKNGKSGVCKHYGYTYEQTEIIYTITINR